MNTRSHWLQNKAHYRIIAGLFTFIGLLIVGMGLGLHSVGDIAMDRYEEFTGRFIRMFSNQDNSYYLYAKTCLKMSKMFLWSGIAISALGIFLFFKPKLLHLFFILIGVDKYEPALRKSFVKLETPEYVNHG